MKLTYIYPPLFKPFYPIATRMITENLLRDRRLEVTFSDIPVLTYSSKVHEKLYDRLLSGMSAGFHPNVAAFLKQKYMLYNVFYVFMTHGYYDEFIFRPCHGEYAVITCINFSDLLIVKDQLERGQKVVLGGPLVNIQLTPGFLRRLLRTMGVDAQVLDRNLIIVSGGIDPETDLCGIIRDWKDARITENRYDMLYECENDFLRGFYGTTDVIPVHLGFSNHCWYGKCKFCTYRGLPQMDFLGRAGEDRVVAHIHKLMNTFQSNQIRFVDSYFNPNQPVVRGILGQLRKYHMTVYSGITLLKNERYLEYLGTYMDTLLIGLESTSDFTLSRIHKGYTFADVQQAVQKIITHLDRRVFLEISLILDLPARDREDVQTNYRRVIEIRDRLEDEGFRVGIHLNILSVFPNLQLLDDAKGLLRACREPEQIRSSSGKNFLISLLKEAGMDRPSHMPSGLYLLDEASPLERYGYLSSNIPVMRYDVHGELLPSDLLILEEETMQGLLERKGRRIA